MNLEFKKINLKTGPTGRYLFQIFEFRDYGFDFLVKRVYFVQDFKQPTGQHCHKMEKEVFIMIKGGCMAVIDRGAGKEEIPFSHGEGMYVGAYVWHGFKDLSPDAILLALSSTNYDATRSDYIEDYEEYTKIIYKILEDIQS